MTRDRVILPRLRKRVAISRIVHSGAVLCYRKAVKALCTVTREKKKTEKTQTTSTMYRNVTLRVLYTVSISF